MGVLLQQVKAETLTNNRLTGPTGLSRGLLEGEHRSMFHGRSLEFDDLRPYILGDDVRDIDWRASARSSSVLVKRFVSYRQQRILAVADIGRNMLALAASGEPKQRVAVNAVGVVGLIANSKGDEMGLVYGDEHASGRMPNRRGEPHLEHMLERINSRDITASGRSSIAAQLRYVERNYRHRHIVFVVSDEPDLSDELDGEFRRLAARHSVYWITIKDAPLVGVPELGGQGYDVDSGRSILREEILGGGVIEAYQRAEAQREAAFDEYVNSSAIRCARVAGSRDLVKAITTMLKRASRAT